MVGSTSWQLDQGPDRRAMALMPLQERVGRKLHQGSEIVKFLISVHYLDLTSCSAPGVGAMNSMFENALNTWSVEKTIPNRL